MNDLLNPYIAGAPVVEASMFFGREDVFTWIENSLSGKFVDHILVLHGQRRVGKTSVLKQIPNFLTSQYVQVFFDLQGRTNTTLERFLWWMASEKVRTLKKEHEIDLPRPKRDAFADPDAFIADFIPALQAVMGDKVLLLTFDEFDTLDRPDIQDSLARPLISFLRRLFEVEGFNFIFSIGSSGNKLENMQATYTDFFKTALYRKVSFLTRDECHSLITKPVAGLITYEPAAIEQIIAITSGHPYFTQLTCHELFARCQKTGSRVVTAADVAEILDDVIERGTVNLKFVWDEASDLEKWILAALGQEEGLNLKGISQLLKSQGVRFVESDMNSAILHLRDRDVLNQHNNFVIRLMQRWLVINRSMDRVREELVQTNPIADRFIEIGDEYRDRKQYNAALENYRRALEIQDNNIEALYTIGSIYLKMRNFQDAAVSFEKALQVDEEHIGARQGYCQAQLEIGDRAQESGVAEEAIGAYQAILNITPVHSQARQNLADIYRVQAETHLANGSEQEALDSLCLAIEMTPEDESLEASYQVIIAERNAVLVADWLDKAEKALKRKHWDEAAQMAEEALKVDPANASLQRRVGEIKDARQQEKISVYQAEAEAAISKGQYPKASKQRKPLWKKLMVYGSFAGVIVLSLGLIFNQRITAFFSPQPTPIHVGEADRLEPGEVLLTAIQTLTETPIFTSEAIIQQGLANEHTPTPLDPTATTIPSQTPTPVPTWVTDFAEPILAYIADRPADVEDNSPREIENTVHVIQGVSFFDYVISARLNGIENFAGFELDNGNGNFVNASVFTHTGVVSDVVIFPTRWVLGKEDKLQFYGTDQFHGYSYNFQIIIKGPMVIFYLNDKPLAFFEYESFVLNRGSRPIIRLAAQTGKATFSNVRIWDITNLDLP